MALEKSGEIEARVMGVQLAFFLICPIAIRRVSWDNIGGQNCGGGLLSPEMGGKLQDACMCSPEGWGLTEEAGQGWGLLEFGQGGKRTLHCPPSASYALQASCSLFRKDLWRACSVAGTVLPSGDTETQKPRSCPSGSCKD